MNSDKSSERPARATVFFVDVNADAPIVGKAQIGIAAPLERVWGLLADIERWPTWNPDVKSAALSGTLAPGSEFRWKSGGVNIRSQLEQVEAPRAIGWTGKTIGLRARHVYRLEPHPRGTRVSSEESYEGWAALLFRNRMETTLQQALDNGLRYLKAEAERRPSP
jgi:uncharacterized protein YndB with AHSA1/START domain